MLEDIYPCYISVPPVIIPFHFDSELTFGERFGVACIVSKGDPPITIEWHKDGVKLSNLNNPGVTITNPNDFTSMLTITNLTDDHSGDITCRAFNNWSQSSYTENLAVNGRAILRYSSASQSYNIYYILSVWLQCVALHSHWGLSRISPYWVPSLRILLFWSQQTHSPKPRDSHLL